MLYVKTKIGPSAIEGIGLFADEFIPKGTIIWRFTPGFDLKFTAEEIQKFPDRVQMYMKRYRWLSKKSDKYCMASDDAKYFNHSSTPNTLSAYYDDEDEVVTKAIKDINPGDELTDNYGSFEKDFREGEFGI